MQVGKNPSFTLIFIKFVFFTIFSDPPKKKHNNNNTHLLFLKVLGKSVGWCKTSKRKDRLYISLLVFVWRIICENFNANGLILAAQDINENTNKENKKNAGFGEALQ